MKSDSARKTLVVFALAILAAVFVLIACASWGILSVSGFISYIEEGPIVLRILIGIAFSGLAVCTVYTIVCAAMIGRQTSSGEMNLLANTGDGTSYISSDAVSGMVTRLLKRNKQIKSSTCTVTPVEDGIVIDNKLVAFVGGDLSRLCAEVQNLVKTEIEGATGIPVRNVSVAIVQTVEGASSPVEKRVN